MQTMERSLRLVSYLCLEESHSVSQLLSITNERNMLNCEPQVLFRPHFDSWLNSVLQADQGTGYGFRSCVTCVRSCR